MKILKGITYEIIRFENNKAFTRAVIYSPNDEIRIDTRFGFIIVNFSFEETFSFEVEIYVKPSYNVMSNKALIADVEGLIFAKLKKGCIKK